MYHITENNAFNTLASGRFRGFLQKNTKTHVDLPGNFSSPVSSTDLVKGSKDTTCSLHSKNNFWLGVADFLWVMS